MCHSGSWLIRLRLVLIMAAAYMSITACSMSMPMPMPMPMFQKEKSVLHQYFDESSGANITSLKEPLVFYKEYPWLSSNTRDYVYLGPIEINRSGSRNYLLWLGIWSTIDRLRAPSRFARNDFQTVYLLADNEPMELNIRAWSGEELGMAEAPYPPPVNGTLNGFYTVTMDQIRKLGQAESIVIQSGSGAEYRLWKKNEQYFSEFENYISGE